MSCIESFPAECPDSSMHTNVGILVGLRDKNRVLECSPRVFKHSFKGFILFFLDFKIILNCFESVRVFQAGSSYVFRNYLFRVFKYKFSKNPQKMLQ